MVLPVSDGAYEQYFTSVDKLPDGRIRQKRMLGVSYVPLTDASAQRRHL